MGEKNLLGNFPFNHQNYLTICDKTFFHLHCVGDTLIYSESGGYVIDTSKLIVCKSMGFDTGPCRFSQRRW